MPVDIHPTLNETPVHHLFNDSVSSALRISVIVPVRDETAHLEQTLDALRNQINANAGPISPDLYEVLLLANNCTDDSYELAKHYQTCYPDFPLHLAQIQLPAHQANIGTVRRLLMDEACRRLLSVGNENGIIASTDGDTTVDAQWLWHIMAEIDKGCDAVAGRIIAQPDSSPARLFHVRDVTYRQLITKVESLLDPHVHDPWPRHFQHFGASFAVTCRAYLQAGRLPEVPYLEDEALYKALLRIDAKIRKSPHVKVRTSARLQGRVAIGFSEQLRSWAKMHYDQQVQLAEPPGALLIRFSNRHRLRLLWQHRHATVSTDELAIIARELCISERWLQCHLTAYPYFGQLWEQVEVSMSHNDWLRAWPPIPITEAIQQLRDYFCSLTATTASPTGRVGTVRSVG
ncbi:glycosyl transferase family protein [Fibrisoma limi BUZ 3]|uniref:Glycosyl transferase family protein n=1 Tax=Fibrisoma limi BUZ 3 TaxID=1185876 RepID=I2GN61_9BACT|nr:glycosyltransferase family 2 protein [Fibrisoma limi]CCH55339.1 glycosyl transferase family protein [Fibrisoma limi BUZ 3]